VNKRRLGNDADFQRFVATLSAFAFVPTDAVLTAWDDWVESVPDDDDDKFEMLEYFQPNYIGLRVGRRNHRRPAAYKIEEWNHFSTILHCAQKTNNYCEAWNRAFSLMVGKNKGSLWGLLRGFGNEAGLAKADRVAFLMGQPPPRRSITFIALAKRFQTIAQSYPYRTLNEYLTGLVYNIVT
jgi:hypothetical protein